MRIQRTPRGRFYFRSLVVLPTHPFVFAWAAILFAGAAALVALDARELAHRREVASWESAPARVQSCIFDTRARTREIHYRYVVAGRSYDGTSIEKVLRGGHSEADIRTAPAELRIRFNPADPSRSVWPHGEWSPAASVFGVVAFAFGIGFLALGVYLRRIANAPAGQLRGAESILPPPSPRRWFIPSGLAA